jgi:hypothetical protein
MFRQKAPRDSKEANYEPGIEKMMEYAKMERLQARLPPVEDVAHAIKLFVNSRGNRLKTIEDTQAQLILQSLRYCLRAQKAQKDDENHAAARTNLQSADLMKLAKAMRIEPRQLSQANLDLAKLLYEELSAPDIPANHAKYGILAYIASLTWSGRSHEARELLLTDLASSTPNMPELASQETDGHKESQAAEADEGFTEGQRAIAWKMIMFGFSREGNETELLRTFTDMEERGVERTLGTMIAVLKFYIKKQEPSAVKQWWSESHRSFTTISEPKEGQCELYETTVSELLTWCLSSGNLELGHGIVKDVMSSNPRKPIWDAVLVWGAGTKKSVEEVNRMLDVMEKSNESIPNESEWRLPDSATLNALVRYAISKNDPYMAERFIALGRERGIETDAETFVLQMDYRLRVNDVDGALVAYKHLQAQDLSTNNDVQAVNRLIVALCTSQRHDFETIMSVVADLSDREASFEALTVSTLSVLHLNRDEIHDVIDLLNTHSFGYSSAERASIRQSLVDYCLDSRTTTTRAWDTYTILRSIFDEMPREQRTQIMLAFFSPAHKRPDMAVNVFNHMRHHSRADTMPDNETYISAFLGCAKLADLESLEVVHNQLKLDYNVTQTTKCRNALLLAYTLCDRPRHALDFWDDIVASREGPTYNSIHIALRACEQSPFGDVKAQDIWSRLRRNDVELDRDMWASYVGALAGNGDFELARSTLEEAEAKGELEVDSFVLGSLLDACPGQSKQAEVEGWAEERYPELWAELRDVVGWEVDEASMKRLKLDRGVEP